MIRTRGATALLVRSLRIEARSVWTYIARTFLCVVLIVWFAIVLVGASFGVAAPGAGVFGQITIINFIALTIVGVSSFASVITEEKEQGTLGLLRMTDLNSVSILLGKIGSRLVSTLLLVIVQLPLVLLCIALGGLTGEQILTVYAVLAAYTLMLAGVATLMSTLAGRTFVASSVMIALLLAHWLLPYWIMLILESSGWGNGAAGGAVVGVVGWIASTTPIPVLLEVFTAGASARFNQAVALYLAVGLAAFVLAWWRFEARPGRARVSAPVENSPAAAAGDATAEATATPAAPATMSPNVTSATSVSAVSGASGAMPRGRTRRSRRVGGSPFLWQGFQFGAGGIAGVVIWGSIWVGVACLFIVPLTFAAGFNAEGFAGVALTVGLIALHFEALILGARFFADDLSDQMLPSLLILPGSLAGALLQRLVGQLARMIVPVGMIAGGILILGDDIEAEYVLMLVTLGARLAAFAAITAMGTLTLSWRAAPVAIAVIFAIEVAWFTMLPGDLKWPSTPIEQAISSTLKSAMYGGLAALAVLRTLRTTIPRIVAGA